MRRIVYLTLPLLLFLAMSTTAQSKNGTIRGIVRDSAGNIMPGVTLSLTDPQTHIVRKRVSDEKGEYYFEAPAGAYDLAAELRGFKTLKISNIELKENDTVPVDVKMTVAGLNGTMRPIPTQPQGRWIPIDIQ